MLWVVERYLRSNYGVNVEEYDSNYWIAFGAVLFLAMQVVTSMACYAFSSVYRAASSKERTQYVMHIVSAVHAAIGGYHGFVIFLEDPGMEHPEYLFEPLYMHVAAMAFHVGYFVQDFFVTAMFHSAIGDVATYVHHVSVISAFMVCVRVHVCVWMTGSLLANEISGPFLHFRYFIRKYNMKFLTTELNAVVLVTSYFVFRIVLTAYHLVNGVFAMKYCFYDDRTADVPYSYKVFVCTLWVPLILQLMLNVMWFKKIVKFSTLFMNVFEYLGVLRLESHLESRFKNKVSGIQEQINETIEHVKSTGMSGVQTLMDSQNEKPKSQGAVRVKYVIRALTWLGGALLFCTDVARRSRTYSQSVEMFCYFTALSFLVLGVFSLFFNNSDDTPRPASRPAVAAPGPSKVKAN